MTARYRLWLHLPQSLVNLRFGLIVHHGTLLFLACAPLASPLIAHAQAPWVNFAVVHVANDNNRPVVLQFRTMRVDLNSATQWRVVNNTSRTLYSVSIAAFTHVCSDGSPYPSPRRHLADSIPPAGSAISEPYPHPTIGNRPRSGEIETRASTKCRPGSPGASSDIRRIACSAVRHCGRRLGVPPTLSSSSDACRWPSCEP